jgi:hypothetical protein
MASLYSPVLFNKARSLPYSGAPERFFNRVGSCFTNRHWTRLERLAMDKHYSLLQKFVNYDRKKLYNLGQIVQLGCLSEPGNVVSQGTLTEGKGSGRLTSSLRCSLFLQKKVNSVFNTKTADFN